MRLGVPHANLSLMTDSPPPLTLTLELTHATDPIAGVVTGPQGTSETFHGWTGLARALGHVAEASTCSDSSEVSPS
jgi:hypothetical protein